MKSFFQKYYDKKLSIILVVFYLITVLINLIRIFSVAYLDGSPLVFGKNVYYQIYLIDIVLVVVIIQFIAMHTKRLILKRTSWRNILIFHFVLALFLGGIIQGVTDFYRLKWGLIQEFDFKHSFRNFLNIIDINFLVYFALLFIIYTYYYFNIIRAKEIKQSNLESELVTAQLNTLKSQMEPHFLFNTLNSIVGLIEIDSKKAQNALVDLSQLLRTITKTTHVVTHTLSEELDLVNPYLEILKVRFNEDILIQIDVDDSLLNENVPTLMFQPLIENSINHGFSQTSGVFKILITGKKVVDKLVFTVENNGRLLTDHNATAQTGIGVSNLKQRLKNIYGNAAQFLIQNKEDGSGVVNRIIIPVTI